VTGKHINELKSSLERIIPATASKTLEDVIWFWKHGKLAESNAAKVRQGNSSYIIALDGFTGVESVKAT
jgi:hypothetical protein